VKKKIAEDEQKRLFSYFTALILVHQYKIRRCHESPSW